MGSKLASTFPSPLTRISGVVPGSMVPSEEMFALISGNGFLIVSPSAGWVCKPEAETSATAGPLAVVAMADTASANVFGLFASIK